MGGTHPHKHKPPVPSHLVPKNSNPARFNRPAPLPQSPRGKPGGTLTATPRDSLWPHPPQRDAVCRSLASAAVPRSALLSLSSARSRFPPPTFDSITALMIHRSLRLRARIPRRSNLSCSHSPEASHAMTHVKVGAEEWL